MGAAVALGEVADVQRKGYDVNVVEWCIVIVVLVVMGVFAVGGFLLNQERKRRRPVRFFTRWPGL